MRVRFVVAACFGAFALMLTLGACSSGSSTSGGASKSGGRIDTKPTLPEPGNGSQGSDEACSIVTQAQVSKLFGNHAAQTPDPTGGTGATSTCVWTGNANQNSKRVLQVRIYPNTDYYTGAKALGGSSVKGVGEKAVVRSAGPLLTLTFVKNGQSVAIEYSITGSEQNPKSQRKSLVAMGKQAASHL